jgi:hypothetical protein
MTILNIYELDCLKQSNLRMPVAASENASAART